MGAVRLDPADVAGFVPGEDADNLAVMCADVSALAQASAPCLRDDEDLPEHTVAAALAIMRGAVIRWSDADSGAVQQQTLGPFSQTVDTSMRKGGLLWPSEIRQLQQLCRDAESESGRKAFQVSLLPPRSEPRHSPMCDLWFGGAACSCGAGLTDDGPLWGGP